MESSRRIIGGCIRRIIAKEPFNNPLHPTLRAQELSQLVTLAQSDSVCDNIEAAKKIYSVVMHWYESRRRRIDDSIGVGNAVYEPLLGTEAIIENCATLCHSLAHLSSMTKSRIVIVYASKASKIMLRDLNVPDEAYATILPKALKEALERWSDDIPVAREILGALQELCQRLSSAVEVVHCGGVCVILDLLDARLGFSRPLHASSSTKPAPAQSLRTPVCCLPNPISHILPCTNVRDELSQTLAIACIANLISQGRYQTAAEITTATSTSVFVNKDFAAEIIEYMPDLVEIVREGFTLRLRLMACAVLSNASIHPTLILSRTARDFGLEQLLHGFGDRLRDQLIGISTPDCALLELKGGTRDDTSSAIFSTSKNELILDEQPNDLELGNMDGYSSQQYFRFGGLRDREPPARDGRQMRRTWRRTEHCLFLIIAISSILWGVVLVLFFIPAFL